MVLRAVTFRTALIPFACTTHNGVSVVIAEPSIRCATDDSDYALMRVVGGASLLVFGAGLPLVFLAITTHYRREMYVDQLLRVRNEGETAVTNPHISTRRRVRKLYEDYTPDRRYWRLVLLARKMALAAVGILLSGDPALQVRGCVAYQRRW